jgi:hypothetical protein
MDGEHAAVGAMEPREHEDLVADPEVTEPIGNAGVEAMTASGAPSSPCFGASAGSTSDEWTRPIVRSS